MFVCFVVFAGVLFAFVVVVLFFLCFLFFGGRGRWVCLFRWFVCLLVYLLLFWRVVDIPNNPPPTPPRAEYCRSQRQRSRDECGGGHAASTEARGSYTNNYGLGQRLLSLVDAS